MAEEAPFAIPMSEMVEKGVAPPGVASYPTAGQGFSLNEQGHVPIVAKDGQWTMEYVQSTFNLSNVVAHDGAAGTISISGLAIGDLCFFIGIPADVSPQLVLYTRPAVCTVAGQISFAVFNADTTDRNEDEETYDFLVIHRHL